MSDAQAGAVLQTELITDWSAGELSDKMLGRMDSPLYRKGADELENFLVMAQGGITRRPGTKYVRQPNTTTATCRLVPFVYATDEAYLVEMQAGNIRVWRGDTASTISSSPTWTAEHLWEIQICQDDNGLYFAHPGYVPQALMRTEKDTFAFGNITFTYHEGGSYPSHATNNALGDNTIEVQEAIDDDVPKQGTLTVKYDTGLADVYTYTSWDTSTFSGVSPSLYRAYDEDDDVVIGHEYHSDGSTEPFAEDDNYPRAMAVFRGRIWFFGGTNDPQRVWASLAYGYEVDSGSGALVVKMLLWDTILTERTETTPVADWGDPEVPETETVTYITDIITDEHAIDITIGSDVVDRILWASAASGDLILGTVSGEWVIPREITARNLGADMVSRHGSGDIQPKLVRDAFIYVSGNKKQVKNYNGDVDLTVFADHITGDTGVVELAYQTNPQTNIFFVRADGELAVLTYEKTTGVIGWQRWVHGDDWLFISVAVIPDTSGNDVVYCVVKDDSAYYIEKFTDIFPTTQSDCVYMDCAENVSSGLGTNHTLAAWANETVSLMIDGVYDSDIAANGSGQIDLSGKSGTLAWAGLPYTPKLRTMPVAGAPLDWKRVNRILARVYRTMDLYAGFDTYAIADMDTDSDTLGDTWYTGDIEIPIQSNEDREGSIQITANVPEPLTIMALVAEYTAEGRG